MKLLSMREFVIEQSEKMIPTQYIKYMGSIVNYAKFLSQPLTLGMFVPCDEKGDIIYWQCPTEKDGCTNDCKRKIMEFNEAKERVLFEGFESDIYQNSAYIEKGNNHIKFKKGIPVDSLRFKIIEDILMFDLTLTQTSIKQLGL